MLKQKKCFISLAIAGLIFCTSTSIAATSTSCTLNGKKCEDATFVNSEGDYVTLTMSCNSSSQFGTMAVIRGRKNLPTSNMDKEGVWLMYPALKCSIGKTASAKRNIRAYAETHNGLSFSNFFSVRLYGNHCDNQKTGCYGTAKGTSTNY